MDIPALHYWAISATQHFHHWYYPSSSEVTLYIENLDVDFGFDLKLDDKGYLDPQVWDVMIDFGGSYIYHDSIYVRYTMFQILQLGKVMIQNSAFFFGDRMFTQLLGPVMDKYLNHYIYVFNQESFVGGQYT